MIASSKRLYFPFLEELVDRASLPFLCKRRGSRMSHATVAPEPDARFAELHASLTKQAAVAESNRCLYCFDAPCMTACPTHIDVPGFIKRLAQSNTLGAARTILDANVLGASCARACPVDVLCEGACVMHQYHQEPIKIGLLQRFAMEALPAGKLPLPFSPAPETGKRVALIGAGPASLACAAELRRRGIAATLFDARRLPGGLNTYGIAEYKLPFGVALHEVERIVAMGVTTESETWIDAARFADLLQSFDAVFVGVGLGDIHRLGIPGEDKVNVTDALRIIAGYKEGTIRHAPPRVVVIGAGNTAIDAAIAAVRLGAERVTMVYRRGLEQISAFGFEYDHAVREGVRFEWFAQPVEVLGDETVTGLRLQRVQETQDGFLLPAGTFDLEADSVVLAIGQASHAAFLHGVVHLERGRVVVDRATGQTSHPQVFAGGDCTNGGREVVDAVADGKRAGVAMAAMLLEARHANA